MDKTGLENGQAVVGGELVTFSRRVVRTVYTMQVPDDFYEDRTLVSNYTYLFSKDKSPLSIAIKGPATASAADEDRQIAHYFGQPLDSLDRKRGAGGEVFYRETVADSKYLSVYSLRFAVETAGGLLFGCFNCSAQDKDDWRPVVLEMLQTIESGESD